MCGNFGVRSGTTSMGTGSWEAHEFSTRPVLGMQIARDARRVDANGRGTKGGGTVPPSSWRPPTRARSAPDREPNNPQSTSRQPQVRRPFELQQVSELMHMDQNSVLAFPETARPLRLD
jgi:hypothetical protein